jgi:hypothetical protein
MTFERFNELMLLFGPVLPVLGLPLYLLFALAGKGASRNAVFLSLSTPGLLIPVYDIWGTVSAEPYVYSTPSIVISTSNSVIFFAIFNPGVWVFPAVFIFQIVNILREKWTMMTKSSGVFIALLLLLYLWNCVVIALINDGK